MLRGAGVPFLVGGAFASNTYTGIKRFTKDLDVFVRPSNLDAACRVLEQTGFLVRRNLLHWLSKAYAGEDFVDIIIGLGNGVGHVDDEWFQHANPANILGVDVLVCPPEEMIWAAAFVMERERYDGAEVAHLLRDNAGTLDWNRLLRRFGADWRVLMSHLVLFGFIYPAQKDDIPGHVMDELLSRLDTDSQPAPSPRLCRGTLISARQYKRDLEQGYQDARPPHARQEPIEDEPPR
jgi:hypothetical protein